MTTSVPQVRSINDQKYDVGTLVEKALELYKITGVLFPLEQAVKLAREFYDSEMKIAAHKGALDWDHLNRTSKALERFEGWIERAKARGVR